MNITGIEVIRPGVAAIGVVAGEKIELTYGDTLRVNVLFWYRGLARKTILEGAIGKLHAFPTDWLEVLLKSGTTIDIPESFEFTLYERSVEIPITSDIDPGTDYDLSVSLRDYREAGHPTEVDVIDIVGVPPTYELLGETIYPYAYVYDGDAEVSTFTFKTDPFTPTDWIVSKLSDAVKEQVEKDGGQVMEMRVYVDKTPLLWTDWRIEVVGIPPKTEGVAMSIGIVWWGIAILAALAIALIIVITWSIKTIVSSFTHKPLSEEIKATWSKETLISIIGDFEVKLELIPKPSEELEGMSDEELRDYCDHMAEEIVPPEISWLPLAIVGGLGVVGIGAAVALAARPRE
ncbi:hypothetical protein ES703_101760 [subsurface metagenome]